MGRRVRRRRGFRQLPVARDLIDTAAVRNVVGGADRARSPEIMADAAMAMLDLSHEEKNGRAFIDADVLRAAGVTDLSHYGGAEVDRDIFVD
jgi:citronellol/citronellal dehydrogenase